MIEFARHCRSFSPNEWQFSLLNENMNYVFPDYYYFKKTIDSATLEIALRIESRLNLLSNNIQEFLQQKMEDLREINEGLSNKMLEGIDINDPATIIIHDNPSQIECYMAFLLIDKTFYEL